MSTQKYSIGISLTDKQYEEALLYCCFINPQLFVDAIIELGKDSIHFYGSDWDIFCDFYETNKRPPVHQDLVLLVGKDRAMMYTEMGSQTPAVTSSYPLYISEVKKSVRKRRIETSIHNRDFESMLDLVYADEEVNVAKKFDQLREKYKNSHGLLGYSTGYPTLDKFTQGLQEGHMWVIGAYTSRGKTTFTANIVHHLIRQGVKTKFISMEMSEVEIMKKLVGLEKGMNGEKYLRRHEKDQEAESKILTHVSFLTRVNNYKTILGKIYTSKEKVIVIDYLQRASGGKNDLDTLQQFCNGIQQVAQKMGKVVIAVSQVNQQSIKEPNPILMGYKGASAIAEALDVGIIITGEDTEEDRQQKIQRREALDMSITVKKNRHGMVGAFPAQFNTYLGKFWEDNRKTPDEAFDTF